LSPENLPQCVGPVSGGLGKCLAPGAEINRRNTPLFDQAHKLCARRVRCMSAATVEIFIRPKLCQPSAAAAIDHWWNWPPCRLYTSLL